MTRDSVAFFRRKSAESLNSVFGQSIQFRGRSIMAVVGAVSPLDTLEDGGFVSSASFRVRVRRSDIDRAPARGEPVTVGGKQYFVHRQEDMLNPCEWVVTIGSARP